MAADRFLFIPVSGPSGSGELQRALILADALRCRKPAATIQFAVSRHARGAEGLPYPTLLLDSSPTHATSAVARLIDELRPTVTIFDGAARVAQLRRARAAGSRTVFVASRPSGRHKVFKWRRLRLLDQIWFTQPHFLEPPLTRIEQWKLGWARRVETVPLGPVYAAPTHAVSEATLGQYGLGAGKYAVFCLGMAARDPKASAVFDLFDRVADALAHESDTVSVVVGGERRSNAKVVHAPRMPNVELLALLAHAKFACLNGGSLLLQALAVGTSCVAVPVNTDQPARISICERKGLAIGAPSEFEALRDCVLQLDCDAARRERLHRAIAEEHFANGTVQAMEALERLTDANRAFVTPA
jgi:hypothetical protein